MLMSECYFNYLGVFFFNFNVKRKKIVVFASDYANVDAQR